MGDSIYPERTGDTKEGPAAGREFVQAVAGASSKEELKRILNEGGICGFDEEQLAESYQNLALSQNWDAVLCMLNDKDFDSCRKRLAAHGIETEREGFDLINEVVASALDQELVAQLRRQKEIDGVMELFHARGYKAITADFLLLVRENARHFYEDALLTQEDIEALSGQDFYERCRKSINLIFALSSIAGLSMGVSGIAEPAFLIAIAGGISLIFGKEESKTGGYV